MTEYADNNVYYSSEYISEKSKNSETYLHGCINSAIRDLVKDTDDIRKCYNYLKLKRDKDQFKYIDDKYGDDMSKLIKMHPLIKSHVNALLGTMLQKKIVANVTYRDRDTIEAIEQEKDKELNDQTLNAIKSSFMSQVDSFINNRFIDTPTVDALDKIKENVNTKFISNYEKTAQNIIDIIKRSKDINIIDKRNSLLLSLVVAGKCAYRPYVTRPGNMPSIEVLNPRNFFHEHNPRSKYIKDSSRAVIVNYMTKEDILTRWGHEISKKDISRIMDSSFSTIDVKDTTPLFNANGDGLTVVDGARLFGYGNGNDYTQRLIPVYEVEWIAVNNLVDNDIKYFKKDRYKGFRIGSDIYVSCGLDETAIRSVNNPEECGLSINGLCMTTDDEEPYSIVAAAMDIQDDYDVLEFIKKSVISNSGSKGQFAVMEYIPKYLGKTPKERIIEWNRLRKSGVAPLSIKEIAEAEDGAPLLNTIFGGYDDTVNPNAINVILLCQEDLKRKLMDITGVSPFMLEAAEQRDAVKNVQVSLNQSSIITKPLFDGIEDIVGNVIIDMINMFKDSFRDGYAGSIALGENAVKFIKLDPKYYTMTDYGITVESSDESIMRIESLRTLAPQLVQSEQIDIPTLSKLMLSDSVTEIMETIDENFSAIKQLKQMQEQMEQLQKQMNEQANQAQNEVKRLQNENEALKQKDRELEGYRVKGELSIKEKEVAELSEYHDKKIELEKARVDLERIQLSDANPYNDKIRKT